MKQIIECVPNISEGRDAEKIKIISSVVENINGVDCVVKINVTWRLKVGSTSGTEDEL